MIHKVTPKIKSTITPPQRNLPHKQVVISSKNGKDRIEQVFIGGIPRYSIIDLLRDIFGF